jgi:hypothetical protein
MSLTNFIKHTFVCPNCGTTNDGSFEVSEGDLVVAFLYPGDLLPWDDRTPPTGHWLAEGIGQCKNCKLFIEAIIRFDGLKYESVTSVKAIPNAPRYSDNE